MMIKIIGGALIIVATSLLGIGKVYSMNVRKDILE